MAGAVAAFASSAALHFSLPLPTYVFLISATIVVYTTHGISKQHLTGSARAAWITGHKVPALFTAILSLVALCIAVFLLPPSGLLLPGVAAVTGSYLLVVSSPHRWAAALRLLPVKAIVLAACWTVATTLLPMVWGGVVWSGEKFLFIAHRFLYLLPLCMLFDFRDRDADKALGYKAILHRASPRLAFRIFFTLALASLFFLAAVFPPFRSHFWIHASPVVLFLFCLPRALRMPSFDLYYLLLDGSIGLSGLLLLLRLAGLFLKTEFHL